MLRNLKTSEQSELLKYNKDRIIEIESSPDSDEVSDDTMESS